MGIDRGRQTIGSKESSPHLLIYKGVEKKDTCRELDDDSEGEEVASKGQITGGISQKRFEKDIRTAKEGRETFCTYAKVEL